MNTIKTEGFIFSPDYVFFMAKNTNDEHVLRAYAQHPVRDVRLAVARNPHAPYDVVEALCSDTDDLIGVFCRCRLDELNKNFAGFQKGMGMNDLASALGFVEADTDTGEASVVYRPADGFASSASAYGGVSYSPAPADRWEVFRSGDYSLDDVWEALGDPNCEWFVLEVIAQHKLAAVRASVLSHPSLPFRTVVSLVDDPAVEVSALASALVRSQMWLPPSWDDIVEAHIGGLIDSKS